MKRRNVLAAALALCLAFALTGCSKDSIINGFNDFLHHASRYALTDEKDLAGERMAGADTYTGAYTAEYDGFSGTDATGNGTYTLSVGSRDCYIAIEGESLHGALALTVE